MRQYVRKYLPYTKLSINVKNKTEGYEYLLVTDFISEGELFESLIF